jgi:uncharacterized protein (TIGR03083 family)
MAVPLDRQRRRMEQLLAGLSDDQWEAPSRCDGWAVRDVVSHLIGVNGFWQISAQMGATGTPTKLLGAFDPASTPDQMVAAMRMLSTTDLLAQFVASNSGFIEVCASLDDDGWERAAEAPPGLVPIRVLAQHALWDAWIHERDIALPMGIAPAQEADEVRACLVYAAAIAPALGFGYGTQAMGSFAVAATGPDTEFVIRVDDSVSVTTGRHPDAPCLRGDAVELVDALSMRAPLPATAPQEWQRLRHGLATAFDSPS